MGSLIRVHANTSAGARRRGGRAAERPRLGDALQTLVPRHIGEANRLMLTTSALALVVFAGLRCLIESLLV